MCGGGDGVRTDGRTDGRTECDVMRMRMMIFMFCDGV